MFMSLLRYLLSLMHADKNSNHGHLTTFCWPLKNLIHPVDSIKVLNLEHHTQYDFSHLVKQIILRIIVSGMQLSVAIQTAVSYVLYCIYL